MIQWNNYNQPSRWSWVFEALLTYITLSDADSVVKMFERCLLFPLDYWDRGKLSVVILFKESIIISKAYNWSLRLVHGNMASILFVSIMLNQNYESSIWLGIES